MSAGSETGDTTGHHPAEGGSIPTPALQILVDYQMAKKMVVEHHYSRRMASNCQFAFVVPNEAACVFSIPPTRWKEKVLELSRLVRVPGSWITLTKFIGLCCDAIRRDKRFDLLVSFADFTQDHHGGIYQACSWNFGGKRKRAMDGVLVGGVFHPGRSCNSRWGTRSPEKLSAILGTEVLPHFDEGKFLYWRALNKNGLQKAERLGLKKLAYPKPHSANAEMET